MTEKATPKKVQLDLHKVLGELGHSPESFARLIDRNASGLRRIIYGQQGVSRHIAKDIVEGLYALGFRDDPRQIWQLSRVPPELVRTAFREQTTPAGRSPSSEAPLSDTPVSDALASLMKAVGRKEVIRVYSSVFDAKPSEKDK